MSEEKTEVVVKVKDEASANAAKIESRLQRMLKVMTMLEKQQKAMAHYTTSRGLRAGHVGGDIDDHNRTLSMFQKVMGTVRDGAAATAVGVIATAFGLVTAAIGGATTALVQFLATLPSQALETHGWTRAYVNSMTSLQEFSAREQRDNMDPNTRRDLENKGWRQTLTYGGGRQMLGAAFEVANRMGMDVHTTAQSIQQLRQFGFDENLALAAVQGGSDVEVATGNRGASERINFALSQILTKDKLVAEELNRQLGNAGVSPRFVRQEAAAFFGGDRNDRQAQERAMQRLGQAGNGNNAVRIIMAAIQRNYNQGRPLGSHTMMSRPPEEMALQRFKNGWQGILAGLADSPAVGKLIEGLTRIGEMLAPGSPVSQSLSRMVEATIEIAAHFLQLNSEDGIAALPGAIDKVTEALKWVRENMISVKDGISTVGEYFNAFFGPAATMIKENFLPVWRHLAASFGDSETAGMKDFFKIMGTVFAFQLTAVLTVVTALSFAVRGLISVLTTLWEVGSGLVNAGLDVGHGFISGIGNALFGTGATPGSASPTSNVNRMFEGVVTGAEQTLDIHSPSKVFEHIGRMSGDGYVNGLESSLDASMGSVVSAVSGVKGRGGGVTIGSIVVNVNGGEDAGNEVVDAIERALNERFDSATAGE